MKTQRAKIQPVVRWASRVIDAIWATYCARRRVILAAAAVLAAAAALWFIIPYAQSEYTASKLQDALHRADGAVLLSMCFDRERELLQVSPEQVHRALVDLYRILQVKQVLVNVDKRHKRDISCKVTFVLAQGGTLDMGADGSIVMIYRGGNYRLFSLSGFLYNVAKRAVLIQYPLLRGEATEDKRTFLRQTVRQFLKGHGIRGVFEIDLRNYPDVAWQILSRSDGYVSFELIDFNKHVSLIWPEE